MQKENLYILCFTHEEPTVFWVENRKQFLISHNQYYQTTDNRDKYEEVSKRFTTKILGAYNSRSKAVRARKKFYNKLKQFYGDEYHISYYDNFFIEKIDSADTMITSNMYYVINKFEAGRYAYANEDYILKYEYRRQLI